MPSSHEQKHSLHLDLRDKLISCILQRPLTCTHELSGTPKEVETAHVQTGNTAHKARDRARSARIDPLISATVRTATRRDPDSTPGDRNPPPFDSCPGQLAGS